jgi:hypothetical protein
MYPEALRENLCVFPYCVFKSDKNLKPQFCELKSINQVPRLPVEVSDGRRGVMFI